MEGLLGALSHLLERLHPCHFEMGHKATHRLFQQELSLAEILCSETMKLWDLLDDLGAH